MPSSRDVSPPREVELKLEMPVADLRRLIGGPVLKRAAAGGATADLVSVYFDTGEAMLHRNGLTLRVRNSGGRHLQTVKQENPARAAVMDRAEWESEVDTDRPDRDAAEKTALAPLLDEKTWDALAPVFETRVRRRTFHVRRGRSEIEVSIDQGEIRAGKESSALCEVELELLRGEPAELYRLARALAEQVPLQLSVRSKSERGYALLADAPVTAVKAAPVVLPKRADAAAAFRAIAHACLHQLAANRPALLAGDPEGVHQMRVALRRLRAAISLFADMLDDPQTEALKAELKWLAGELGDARELDVFLARVVRPLAGRRPDGGMALVASDLEARRNDALVRAKAAVDGARCRALVLDIAGWIEAGDWMRGRKAAARRLRTMPVDAAARGELKRRRKTILKRGRALHRLDPAQRHRLRIQTKKLRYAAEFFAAAFPGKAARKRRKAFVAALEGLQDALGDLNDIAVHTELTQDIAEARTSSRRRGTPRGLAPRGAAKRTREAFAAGRLSGREEARIAPLLAEAERMHAAFAKRPSFWR